MIDSSEKLTVGKYLQIREILKNKDLEELDMQARLIALLNDTTLEDVLSYSIPKYSSLVPNLDFLMEAPKAKPECPSSIKINGKKYNVVKKIDKINAAQYIDYQSYLKTDDPEMNMAEIMSVFIIPEGKSYNEGYDLVEVVNDIKEHLPLLTCLNICFFFRKKEMNYIKRTVIFLDLMMKIWKRKMKTKEQKEQMEEAEREMKLLKDFLTNGDTFTGLIK